LGSPLRLLASTALLAVGLAASAIPTHGQGPVETPGIGLPLEPPGDRPTEPVQTPRPGLPFFLPLKPGVSGPAGFYLIPSLSLSAEYDDNLFSVSSGRKSDFITRISPGLEAAYRSASTTLRARYSDDAELYLDNSELNSASARQRWALDVRHLPTARSMVALEAMYTETDTPAELRPEAQVETPRQSATLFRIAPSASYQLGPRTSADGLYSYEHTTGSEGVTNDTHHGRLGLSRELTPVDTGAIAYALRVFQSDEEDSGTVISHAVTLRLTHRFGPNTLVTLEAGPRFSEGTIEPEVSAFLAHRFRWATVSIAYARSQTTLIGEAGPMTTESLSTTVGFEPFRKLQISLGSFLGRTSGGENGGSDETAVLGLSATAIYPLTTWMSLRAAYRFAVQDEDSGTIRHNIFTLGVDVSYPFRVY
jgi:hypothetical protein